MDLCLDYVILYFCIFAVRKVNMHFAYVVVHMIGEL